ncbi:hypothetical protein OIU84_022069 [Salix udensis]|uniref:Uncharacterized protein n=1 Tax=Salix udensis TaxID=889485 RepID=A0AAD6KQ20_9ROSI|nr:hypothetical protein OIU84_022069 [Salix udensis]
MVYAVVQLSFMGVSLGCGGSGGLLQIGELGFVICVLAIVDLFLEVPSGEKGGGISFSGCIQLVGFCTFEACVVDSEVKETFPGTEGICYQQFNLTALLFTKIFKGNQEGSIPIIA